VPDLEIEQLRMSLGGALGDVRRAFEGGARVGAFILGAHLIDTMAGLTYSIAWQTNPGPEAWDEFIERFMPQYQGHSKSLYKGFRCAISHRYSLEGIRLTHGPTERDRHWQEEDGHRILHLETFIDELEAALAAVYEQAHHAELRNRIVPRVARSPLLGLIPPTASARAASGASYDDAYPTATGPVLAPAVTSVGQGHRKSLGDVWAEPTPPKMKLQRRKRRRHGRP
jgi:hypothetical protein